MEKKKLLERLDDIEATIEYELKMDSVPKRMQLDIMEALNNLDSAVYAATGYSIIHPKQ